MEQHAEASSQEKPMSLSSLITALTTMRDDMGADGRASVYIAHHDSGMLNLGPGEQRGLEQVEFTYHRNGDEHIIILHGEG